MFDDPDGSVTGGEEGCNTYIRCLDFMLCWCLCFVDKQQSPCEKSMPTSGEAGGACQLAEMWSKPVPNIQNETQNRPLGTDR